jgi:3-dehydroquinate dehydratase-1
LVDRKWRVCAAITENNPAGIRQVAPIVDFFEVRIDLVGSGWRELAAGLEKPWIACNRRAEEGGSWQGSESGRIDELLSAIKLGPAMIDIELASPDVTSVIREVNDRAECLLSYHDLKGTPPLDELKGIIEKQMGAGADICKVVTTARNFADNINVLKLISCFPENRMIAFAMGEAGYLSRVLSPLAGGYLTYASIEGGKESAPGQLAVSELLEIYGVMNR